MPRRDSPCPEKQSGGGNRVPGDAGRVPPRRRDWSWRSQAFRGLVYQVIAIALVALGVWFLAHNTLENMRVRGIQSGFDFLTAPAGFDIGETLFNYDALDPYWKAFLIGVANTLRVAIIGVIFTTILGTLLGVGRFSRNALVRGLCYGYVELFRNIPVLLQLLMWYLVFTELLPDPFEPVCAFGLFYLSKGGFQYPVPVWGLGQGLAAIGALVGLVVALLYRRWAQRKFEQTGHVRSMFWVPLAIVVAAALLGWVAGRGADRLECAASGRRNGRRRCRGDAGVHGGAARPGVLHLGVRCRGRARRHPVGLARAGRGGQQPGSVA